MTSRFIPPEHEYVHAHYYGVVSETVTFCGDIFTGATVLNVGCGEMLTDFGFLGHGVKRIVGLDIDPIDSAERLGAAKTRLATAGISVRPDYDRMLSYKAYDGVEFPFANDSFDIVFSWSAFEHIPDVHTVLSEMRRVLKRRGNIFVQVFPWYHTYYGNHLTDYIREPYFHLEHDESWVQSKIDELNSQDPGRQQFLTYMVGQYKTLNKYSANMFYRAVRDCGLTVVKAGVISYEMDLSQAPDAIAFSDLMILGTKMLIQKS
jgi:ubiquinone/menaquinone biosynthesis C-methylase UbiE